MTPNDISRPLPNGFHGALIERITTDYLRRTAEFILAVLVSELHAAQPRFRACRLTVTGLAYLFAQRSSPSLRLLTEIAHRDREFVGYDDKTSPPIASVTAGFGRWFLFQHLLRGGMEWVFSLRRNGGYVRLDRRIRWGMFG